MKRISIKIAALLLIIGAHSAILSSSCSSSCNSSGGGCLYPKTIFVPRSQSVNAARDLVGQQDYINQPFDRTYGCFSVTPEFTRSFRPDLITDYFFGPAAHDGCVTFSGSTVANRGANDILADYFGLPQDFQSTACFTPRIENFLVDFFFYAGFGDCAKGTYFKLHAPLVYTRWSMNPCETVINEGSAAYPKGYMTLNSIPRSELATSVLPALAGKATFGDMQTPLQYGKIPCGTLTKTRLSDVQMWLGYNFVNCDYAHFGLNINTTIPTGNKPDPEYLFAPVVGNGGFYQAGLGITSHARIWQNAEETQSVAVYFDVNIRHSFDTLQLRSFDLEANGALSRYMLAAAFTPIPRNLDGTIKSGHLTNGDSTEYAQSLQNVINFSTVCCTVNVKLDTDAALKFSYTNKQWQADLGYNFWARSAEEVIPQSITATNPAYGIKGDAFLYGASSTVSFADAQANYPTDAIALSATQAATATSFAGNNYHVNNAALYPDPTLNFGVDSHTDAGIDSGNVYSPNSTFSTIMQISSNIASLNNTNPFENSATSPSVVTHKLFTHVSYNWDTNKKHVHPFLGLGGEAEFDTKRKSVGDCTSCSCRAALNQWGIWLKGGVGF